MMLQKSFLKYLAAWPSETQGHRAIRYKSAHAQIHLTSGLEFTPRFAGLLSLPVRQAGLAGASTQTPEPQT
jgi:hypothetical protein